MEGRVVRQQAFVWKGHGGRRAGAGRKSAPANVGLQPHVSRPAVDARVPVHVTMRAMRGAPKMRSDLVAPTIVDELRRASARDGFRVLHHSVQDDHLHLIVEADDDRALSFGMQRFASRVARLANALVGRRGKFWRERYHRRDLGSPSQFRNALVYVTMNYRKHAPGVASRRLRMQGVDPLSSAIWIDDWASETVAARMREHRGRAGPRPTVPARTWVARVGWKKLGALDPKESPKSPG